MSSKLGVYWAPTHRRPTDYAYFKTLDPSVIKIQDGGQPDYLWVRENLPAALVIAREWALSEQKDDALRDPEHTGRRHAQEWALKRERLGFYRPQTIVLGLNEPTIWAAGWIEVINRYTVSFLDECTKHGLRGGALQFSVGWPGNNGPDTPPDWTPFAPVEAAIKRGKHVLVLHEYFAQGGPAENWGWWCGRALRCPWDVPIVIGECGMDVYVKDGSVPHNRRGWQANVSADTYAKQLVDYTNRMAADPRIVGVCPFLSDYANKEWQPFDVEPAYSSLLARRNDLVLVPKEPTPMPTPVIVPTPKPTPVQPPAAPSLRWPLDAVKVTQWYGERPDAYARFGLRGHNGVDFSCIVGTPVKAVADGEIAYTGVDSAYGVYVRIWHKALRIHTFYAHLDAATVAAGEMVSQGQTIALSGNTGNSSGPHLHYEIRIADAEGKYQTVARMGKGAVDPVSFAAGLERRADLY